MTETHLIRLEAINLAPILFDTRDLSTIRGSSLLLLDAVQRVTKWLAEFGCNPVSLSQGASMGLWRVQTTQLEHVLHKIRSHLCQDPQLTHATFVLTSTAESSAFQDSNESLLASQRWAQMQSLSLVIPPTPPPDLATVPPSCELDGLRPATKKRRGINRDNGEPTFLSESTAARRSHGRDAKQSFYRSLTGIDSLPPFASEFEDIAVSSNTSALNGKMAVFYADGNSFGQIQRDHCTGPKQQALWDHFIRSTRRDFLTVFLKDEVLTHPDQWLTDGGEIRFEILLWGGDEVMFVMPGTLGWRFAQRFFESFEDTLLSSARFPTAGEAPNHPFADDPTRFETEVRLSHAAALVFCHHHAPIHRIQKLAREDLAEFAKETDRSKDHLACLALESFDHLGSGFASALQERYKGRLEPKHCLISANDHGTLARNLAEIASSIDALKAPSTDFPRSQLRSFVTSAIRSSEKDISLKSALESEFRNATPDARQELENLKNRFSTQTAFWFQTEELWDYARP